MTFILKWLYQEFWELPIQNIHMTFTELTLITLALDKYQTQITKCPVGAADFVPSGTEQYEQYNYKTNNCNFYFFQNMKTK